MYDHNGGIYIGLWRIAPQEADFEETVSGEELINQTQPKGHTQVLAAVGEALV
ncbi:MAG: hypothetical protein GY797_37725 [Deltaproteobacteria bacterium]|nr:hypothetical protein [Deltaproteobacteria bacterium]